MAATEEDALGALDPQRGVEEPPSWCYLGVTMASTTTLKLPEALKKRIEPLAESAGRTAHAWMVAALEAQVSSAEKRNAFHDEARARLAEFDVEPVAYRARDVHRFSKARASGRKAARPRRVKI